MPCPIAANLWHTRALLIPRLNILKCSQSTTGIYVFSWPALNSGIPACSPTLTQLRKATTSTGSHLLMWLCLYWTTPLCTTTGHSAIFEGAAQFEVRLLVTLRRWERRSAFAQMGHSHGRCYEYTAQWLSCHSVNNYCPLSEALMSRNPLGQVLWMVTIEDEGSLFVTGVLHGKPAVCIQRTDHRRYTGVSSSE